MPPRFLKLRNARFNLDHVVSVTYENEITTIKLANGDSHQMGPMPMAHAGMVFAQVDAGCEADPAATEEGQP